MSELDVLFRKEKTMKLWTELGAAALAARKAGDLLRAGFFQETESQIEMKSLPGQNCQDVVTAVDRAASEIIIRTICRKYPLAFCDSEEGKVGPTQAIDRWIIDPLDGTRGFVSGVPCSVVSVALERQHEIVLGLVLNPFSGLTFSAMKGEGINLELGVFPGKGMFPPPISNISEISQARIFIYHSQVPELAKPEQEANQYRWLREQRCWLVHIPTSVAYAACLVATGKAEAFIGYGDLAIHDWAAAKLIVEEAGGKTFVGEDGHDFIATNGKIQLPPSVFPGFPE